MKFLITFAIEVDLGHLPEQEAEARAKALANLMAGVSEGLLNAHDSVLFYAEESLVVKKK